jgi:BASS family bile acid:Na+ symporter
MNVILPVLAVAAIRIFSLKPAVEIALVALSLSPVPPFMPKQLLKSGSRQDYTLSLLAVATLASLILIPLAIAVLGQVLDLPVSMPAAAVIRILLFTVLLPLAAGIAIRYLAPTFADRAARPVDLASMALLAAGLLPVLLASLKPMASLIGDGTLAAFAAFSLIGLAVGHRLGGPEPGNRMVLAFCTAGRHPGVAIAIAHANFPDQKLAPMAILLYLLLNMAVSSAYLRRQHPSVTLPAGGTRGPAPRGGGPEGLKPA